MEKYSEKRRLGNFAEDIAEMFLVKLGYNIKNRNYLKKWGELDVVAEKKSILHFIEVKSSISRENRDINVSQIFSQTSFTTNSFQIEISHETNEDVYRPEENVHFWKQKRMLRTIETYLLEKNIDDDQEWQIDILSIKLDFIRKVAIIDHIENVVFEV